MHKIVSIKRFSLLVISYVKSNKVQRRSKKNEMKSCVQKCRSDDSDALDSCSCLCLINIRILYYLSGISIMKGI